MFIHNKVAFYVYSLLLHLLILLLFTKMMTTRTLHSTIVSKERGIVAVNLYKQIPRPLLKNTSHNVSQNEIYKRISKKTVVQKKLFENKKEEVANLKISAPKRNFTNIKINYAQQLGHLIARKIDYPKDLVRKQKEGQILVEIHASSEGIKEVVVIKSSNDPDLDLYTVDSIKKINKLPIWPAVMSENEIVFKIPIQFRLKG